MNEELNSLNLKNGDKVSIIYRKGVNGAEIDATVYSFVFMDGKLVHHTKVKQDNNGNWGNNFIGNCVAISFSKCYSHIERC